MKGLDISRYRWTPEEREAALLQLLDVAEPRQAKPAAFVGIVDTLEESRKHMSESGRLTGLSTGYGKVDEWTGGMGSGQVILVYADTGIGKSLFAQNVALNVAAAGKKVCFIGLEMTNAENTARFVMMTSEEQALAMPIFYPSEAQEVGMNDLDGLYNSAVKEGAELIVIDHLHAMPLPPAGSEASSYEALTWAIKRTTRKYNLPTLLLAHVSYSVKGKKGFPDLSDIKGSSAIKQCADAAIALMRDVEDDPQTLKLKLAKIRGRKFAAVPKTELALLDNARLADQSNVVFPV